MADIRWDELDSLASAPVEAQSEIIGQDNDLALDFVEAYRVLREEQARRAPTPATEPPQEVRGEGDSDE